MNRELVIRITGKASEVFKLFSILCKQRGNIKISELRGEDVSERG